MNTTLMNLAHRIEKRARQAQLAAYKSVQHVGAYTPFQNVYYCCTQKTASQWFKAVFLDPLFYRYTGLSVVPHPPVPRSEVVARFARPFPSRSIATHLYIDFPTYENIPKPENYRTFFVIRDPRDIVTSWYFSTLYSHHPYPKVMERRSQLQSMNLRDGLIFSIDVLHHEELFTIQRSWAVNASTYGVRIFRYEDFAKNNLEFLRQLLHYLHVRIPESAFETLSRRHHFTKYSGNRDQGIGDHLSHYRKGIAGDWMNHFDADVETHFERRVGDLLEVLGYTAPLGYNGFTRI